jgi:hypothetical protein
MPHRIELHGLMQRYCQLARLLPPLDADFRDGDVQTDARLVLAELARVQAEINYWLGAPGKTRQRPGAPGR